MKYLVEYQNWNESNLPSYQEAVQLCNYPNSPFYETKTEVDGFPISTFNYRLAQSSDFSTPKSREMRGITYVFNKDGSLFNRFILLEKFFNLNQVSSSMYHVVKNYKIKFVNRKEDGSIASFIQLPNGKIIGKTKMGFSNDQAEGINRVYKLRKDVKSFVDWTIKNNITAIFEYVAPTNRIVLRYSNEDLILLRLRDNSNGEHLNLNDYLDKIGSVKIAPFKDDFQSLDDLIEVVAKYVDEEGVVVQAEDSEGKDYFFKLKSPWYVERHGLLTEDIYKENIIIGYILEDRIDDVLGQIPEDEIEARQRIDKIINIVKNEVQKKEIEIKQSYKKLEDLNFDRKEYAIRWIKKDPNFPYVMRMFKGEDPYEIAKSYVFEKTKRLQSARQWLKSIDSSLFFKDIEPDSEDN